MVHILEMVGGGEGERGRLGEGEIGDEGFPCSLRPAPCTLYHFFTE